VGPVIQQHSAYLLRRNTGLVQPSAQQPHCSESIMSIIGTSKGCASTRYAPSSYVRIHWCQLQLSSYSTDEQASAVSSCSQHFDPYLRFISRLTTTLQYVPPYTHSSLYSFFFIRWELRSTAVRVRQSRAFHFSPKVLSQTWGSPQHANQFSTRQ
jgi:hypothetical protein